MEWREEGLLIAVRRHGESAAIVDVLTRERGRYAGLVRGGAGRRLQPVLQPGAQLDLSWRARLEDHLGSFTVEPLRARSGLMADRLALAGLQAITAMASFALAERQAYPGLYDAAVALLDRMEAGGVEWAPAYVGWELLLLRELGFGLDLSCCAVSGSAEALTWVSPKSGRAVSAKAGAEWADRLLVLPPFLSQDAGETPITAAHISQGLQLTGHFLAHRLVPALSKPALPPARERLLRAIARL